MLLCIRFGWSLKLLKKLGQIADCCDFDARGNGLRLSAVAVTELLCTQVSYIQLVMPLSGALVLMVF